MKVQWQGSAPGALAQTETEEYDNQTRKLSLSMTEPRGGRSGMSHHLTLVEDKTVSGAP